MQGYEIPTRVMYRVQVYENQNIIGTLTKYVFMSVYCTITGYFKKLPFTFNSSHLVIIFSEQIFSNSFKFLN